MRLNEEQKKILDGKEGGILQDAIISLIKYGNAMGAEEFIPISSAHTAFSTMDVVALAFPPRGKELTKEDINEFSEAISDCQVRVKTTTNPGIIDRERWQEMGANEVIHNSVMRAMEISKRCGIMMTCSCTPYIGDNIPLMGEHCAWAESSAHLYINSFLGARTNRDSYETSLYSALLGITPNFGMHLDENRKGTDLVDVQCELNNTTDWGALGYFTGEKVGLGIPVFTNLNKPTMEEAVQLTANCNSPGGIPMLLIPGVSPEAPTGEVAFGKNILRKTYIFDEAAKRKIYEDVSYEPEGKVDMVFLGCPHKTLYEIKKIAQILKGKHVANDTSLWIMTSYSIRALAKQLGYAQIIEDSGGKLFADGCLLLYYVNAPAKRPKMDHVVTDSLKQGFGVRRSFHSNIFVTDTERCIEIAIGGA